MDKIFIEGLLLRCILGVNQEERREPQDIILSIVLETDLRRPGKSDDFNDAVDYRALKKKILSMALTSKYYLVESLAEAVAAICLEDQRVHSATVRVEKPTALRFARTVGVEITRSSNE